MMTVKFFRRALMTKPCVANVFSRSLTSTSVSVPGLALTIRYSSHLVRFRHLVDALTPFHRLPPSVVGLRCFATHQKKKSSLNDPKSTDRSSTKKEIKKNSIDKKIMKKLGHDFKHWKVVMKDPEGNPTREEIIDSFIKTLAMVVGSEDEAKRKIYKISMTYGNCFGALVSEELSYKIRELPGVFNVVADSYYDVKNKKYRGEPFINGQAYPELAVPLLDLNPLVDVPDEYPGGDVDYFDWLYVRELLRRAEQNLPNFNSQISETPPMPTVGGALPNQMPTMDEAPPNQMLDIGGAQPNPMPNMEEAPPNLMPYLRGEPSNLMPYLRGEPSNPIPNMGGGPSNLMPQERFSEQDCENSEDVHYHRDSLTD